MNVPRARAPSGPARRAPREARIHVPQEPSNQQVMDAVQEMARKVEVIQTGFTAFRDALPDAYLPRREADQRFASISEHSSNFRERLGALEEWRLAETRRAAEQSTTLQNQIQSAALAAVQEMAKARAELARDVHDQRAALDGRTIAMYVAVLLTLLGFLLNYFSAHVILR